MNKKKQFHGMKVLIVEDVVENITVVSKILEDIQVDISVATNGEEALSMVYNIDPDLVILDVGLPGIDGFEVCGRLKKDPTFYETPVIFVTGLTDISSIANGFSVGGVDYITKPYRPEEVLARVLVHLEVGQLKKRIARSLTKLKQSNESLSEFATVASHDLQEPLRKIRAFGNLLKKASSEHLDSQKEEYLNKIIKSSERMQDLVDNLLEYSKIPVKDITFEPVKLKDVVEIALDNLEIKIKETGGRIDFGELPLVEANKTQMIQLFQNILDNALKYSQKDRAPVIKVTFSSRKNRCQIVLEDNGIGMDNKHLSRIFKPFERLWGKNEYEGVGMGLAICKKIVDRHNGEITVNSVLGKGSAFIITLPEKQVSVEI